MTTEPYFTDKILDCYENSRGCLIDNAKILIEANRNHPRKSIIFADVDDLPDVVEGKKYHLIFFNFMLHHCVIGGYLKTIKEQRRVLEKALNVLEEDGHIMVVENLPRGFLGDRICSFIINRVTSSKLLASLVKQMGVNTAGVGLCFLGEEQWRKQFAQCGLKVEGLVKFKKWGISKFKQSLITMKDIRCALFILKRTKDF